MKKIFFFPGIIVLFLFPGALIAQHAFQLQGTVYDSLTHKPSKYVNIGIFHKNIGTVSNEKGRFSLGIPEKYKEDSVLFSCVGYQTKRIYIPDLIRNIKNSILLQPKSIELAEVKITSHKLTQAIKGNKAKGGSIGLVISHVLGYGSEIGTRIKLPDKPVIINAFNFHINYDRPDSALFRLKIYSYKKGIGNLLINKNIYFMVKDHYKGDYKVNLHKYHIVVQKDIFVSIECLKEYTHGYDPNKKLDKNFYDRIIISAKLFGSKSYVREVSQGNWVKPEMAKSPSFWLNVSY